MYDRSISKLLIVLLSLSLLVAQPRIVNADVAIEEAAKLLPESISDYRAVDRPHPVNDKDKLPDSDFLAQSYNLLSSAARSYRSAKGEKFALSVTRTRSDSGAYSYLTGAAQSFRRSNSLSETIKRGEVGTASFVLPDRILFFKGPTFVTVSGTGKQVGSNEEMLAFARLFADGLDKGEGEIPVLVKHLPDWENAQGTAAYVVTLEGLQSAARSSNGDILKAVNFEAGTEAVVADYGASQLVLVEYSTPQIATASDAQITARIKESGDAGQSVPSAYRRVGNYSVFVFNAPDQNTAAQLIDSVSYEQVVQWLGDNPRALERMQRMYTETTAGIILAVIKASGLAVLLCLSVGGIFGALIFRRRRAQQAATAAYSDAGDMIRLNIDDLTPRSSAPRLLGRGDS